MTASCHVYDAEDNSYRLSGLLSITCQTLEGSVVFGRDMLRYTARTRGNSNLAATDVRPRLSSVLDSHGCSCSPGKDVVNTASLLPHTSKGSSSFYNNLSDLSDNLVAMR